MAGCKVSSSGSDGGDQGESGRRGSGWGGRLGANQARVSGGGGGAAASLSTAVLIFEVMGLSFAYSTTVSQYLSGRKSNMILHDEGTTA